MIRTLHPQRLRALLLLGMVLGGLGLPALDAVIYHGARSQAVSHNAVAAPGTPAGHAVLCAVADQLASTRSLAATPPQPFTAVSLIAVRADAPSSPTTTLAQFSPALPRAPPLALV